MKIKKISIKKEYKNILIIISILIVGTIGNFYYILQELEKNNIGNQISKVQSDIIKLNQNNTMLKKYESKEIGRIEELFKSLNYKMIFMYDRFLDTTKYTIKSQDIGKNNINYKFTPNKYIKNVGIQIGLQNETNFINEYKTLIYFRDMIKGLPFEIERINFSQSGLTELHLKLYGKI